MPSNTHDSAKANINVPATFPVLSYCDKNLGYFYEKGREKGRERDEEEEMTVIMERLPPGHRGEKIDIAVDC